MQDSASEWMRSDKPHKYGGVLNPEVGKQMRIHILHCSFKQTHCWDPVDIVQAVMYACRARSQSA